MHNQLTQRQKKTSPFVFVAALALYFSVAAKEILAEPDSGERRYEQFAEEVIEIGVRETREGVRAESKAIKRVFMRYFGDLIEQLDTKKITDQNLLDLYAALPSVLSSPNDGELGKVMVSATREISRRGLTVGIIKEAPFFDHPADYTYDSLISAHLFELADELASMYPETIDPFGYSVDNPLDFDPSTPAILIAEKTEANKFLVPEAVPISSGLWLVAVVHPDCPYSRNAMQWIETNWKTVLPLLPKNTIWVTSQLELAKFDRIENGPYPGNGLIDIKVANLNDSWPKQIMITYTPTFHLFQDGVLVGTVNGWSNDHSPEEFLNLLRQHHEP